MSDTLTDKTTLKSYFEDHDAPNQSQFDDLITTMVVEGGNTGSLIGAVQVGNVVSATSQYSFSQGNNATASNVGSWATGQNVIANKIGQFSRASGRFLVDGDAQISTLVTRNSTTNNTQTELFLDGSAARITIDSNTTCGFTTYIVARRVDGVFESAFYKFEGAVTNNSGTTALVGIPTKTVIVEDTGAWDVTVEADDTNDSLVFKVTGENSKTIQWVAKVELVETKG